MRKIAPFKRFLFFSSSRWFVPGMGLKRWLLLLGVGTAVASLGLVNLLFLLERQSWLPISVYDLLTLQFLPAPWQIVLPLLLGGMLIVWAVLRLGRALTAPFQIPDDSVAERIYEHSRRRRGPNIVAIGGGTGMPGLLRGLTDYTRNITAIVTVADDGGSSGRLRREFGLLPPGDFRNNIAALSRDEALMTQVLQYRFGAAIGENGHSPLQGHAFGNLLLAALTGITGSFDEALLAAERVLALRGKVLPSTLADVALAADILLPDGTFQRVVGESKIPEVNGRIQQISLQPSNVRAYPAALQAIFQADLIVMGPGSLYTSILPNLLVPDLVEALLHARAPKIYICNLATQPGETDNYSVADHVATLFQHIPTGCLDLVIANDNLSIPPDRGGGNTIYVQLTPPDHLPMVTADLVDEARPWRHDGAKLAQAVMRLLS
ncbi:gluconeogenesis factor YvcK family protein [Candidatus Leptofilum sp.]|uniref:gluconeogenesis factor YvcK family protein n=1 Tax=Candidatus Leptofilum sp. TaxID=3241576 RepID=UPI003B58ECE7